MYHEEARDRARLEGEQMKKAQEDSTRGSDDGNKIRPALEIPDHLITPS
jgi:hypothetical protein